MVDKLLTDAGRVRGIRPRKGRHDRHEALAREQLAQCRSELAGARLLTEGERPETVSPDIRDEGRFLLCPGPTDRRAG